MDKDVHRRGLVGYRWKMFAHCLEVQSSKLRSHPWLTVASERAYPTHHHVPSSLPPQSISSAISWVWVTDMSHLNKLRSLEAPDAFPGSSSLFPLYNAQVNVRWSLPVTGLKPSSGFPVPWEWNSCSSSRPVSPAWSGLSPLDLISCLSSALLHWTPVTQTTIFLPTSHLQELFPLQGW